MGYVDDRAHGIALLRKWAQDRAAATGPREAHGGLASAMNALLQEFRVEFDVPGARYWYHPESECYFSTMPNEHLADHFDDVGLLLELTRHEFTGRQALHYTYDEDRL